MRNGGRWMYRMRGRRRLCGCGCILAGVLVLVCFLPNWLVALVFAGVLFWVGVSLLGILC